MNDNIQIATKIRQGIAILCGPLSARMAMIHPRDGIFKGFIGNPKSTIRSPKLDGPGAIAAWNSAAHVEKAPEKKKPPTP